MNSNRNAFLDILKAICILFVIITHDSISDAFRLKMLFPFWINMAVPLFMIISGYVYAISFEKNGISEIQQAYTLNFIVPKFIRYTVPFVMAYSVELCGRIIFVRHDLSIKSWIVIFFQGGSGPGSYYYPILLQFLLFYPVLYFIIRKYTFKGLMLCLLINACFEFFQRMWFCNAEFYRLLLYRYTFVIAFGSYLYQKKDEKINPLWQAVAFLIGVLFIVLYCYIGMQPKIIIYWTSTCFLACLYLVPIAKFLIQNIHIGCKPLEIIGKASFNIFLVQMVYFVSVVGFIQKIISLHFLQLCAHIGICVTVGLAFYVVEQKLTKYVLTQWNGRRSASLQTT